jgi:hypothetical protein
MTLISCDACKKHISGARKDVNYVAILDKDLCVSCNDKLMETVKRQSIAHAPYAFRDYQEGLQKNLVRMCAK